MTASASTQNATTVDVWEPDAETPETCHRLGGIEPENLLAFLALLGFLRALEVAHPDWGARVSWDVERHPWRPVLTLAEPQTEVALAEATAEGVDRLAGLHRATGDAKDLKYTRDEFLALRSTASPDERAVLDALASDAAEQEKKNTLWPTPFAFMFGQGHQYFLERFRSVPSLGTPPQGRGGQPFTPERVIARALFVPWAREHRTDSFRWDPEEDRRHAHRAVAPTADPLTTEHGANRLAAVALPLLPVTVVVRRSTRRVLTSMTRYNARGEIEFSWPVWSAAAKLPGVISLLRHPLLSADEPDLSPMPQVLGVYRARRISVGKYFNVTRGERVV